MKSALAAFVLALAVTMIVPLPAWLLDLLLASNLALAVLVLLAALHAKSALAISTFPTMLLVTTLTRLALHVSSARLILLRGDAGEVVRAFGHFVVQGDVIAGLVVFVLLTFIQFFVIAKGGERIAEVGARFALDALPGRQMSLDTELRAGAISAEKARKQRHELHRESQFYGAMDGAMKFVKGDAVASIVIACVNLVGGIAIATTRHDAGLRESFERYGLLAVGDGLVAQVPALLVSTAAGLVVARVSSENDATSTSYDVVTQLFGTPRALAIAAGFFALLAAVPKLPTLPFLAIASALALGAWALARRARSALPQADTQGTPIGLDATQRLIDELERTAPVLVRHVTQAPYSLPLVTSVLQRLASEGIRPPLHDVFEALAFCDAAGERNPAALTDVVRTHLRGAIAQRFAPSGRIEAVLLSVDVEDAIRDAITQSTKGPTLALHPDIATEIRRAIRSALAEREGVLLTQPNLRRHVRELIEPELPHVAVLSFAELPPTTQVEPIARVAL